MADDKKKEAAPEAPLFMVTQKFFDGSQMHEPGAKIYWSVPEGWDEAKQGKHHAQHPPSLTFRPLNKEAEDLLAKHKASKKK